MNPEEVSDLVAGTVAIEAQIAACKKRGASSTIWERHKKRLHLRIIAEQVGALQTLNDSIPALLRKQV